MKISRGSSRTLNCDAFLMWDNNHGDKWKWNTGFPEVLKPSHSLHTGVFNSSSWITSLGHNKFMNSFINFHLLRQLTNILFLRWCLLDFILTANRLSPINVRLLHQSFFFSSTYFTANKCFVITGVPSDQVDSAQEALFRSPKDISLVSLDFSYEDDEYDRIQKGISCK